MTEADNPARLQFGIRALLSVVLAASLVLSAWATLGMPGLVLGIIGAALFFENRAAIAMGQPRPWFVLHVLVVLVSLVVSLALAMICAILLVKLQWAQIPLKGRGLDFSFLAYWINMPAWAFVVWCLSLLLYTGFRYARPGLPRGAVFVVGSCLALAGGMALAHAVTPELFEVNLQGPPGVIAGVLYCLIVSQFAFWGLVHGDRGACRLTDTVRRRWLWSAAIHRRFLRGV